MLGCAVQVVVLGALPVLMGIAYLIVSGVDLDSTERVLVLVLTLVGWALFAGTVVAYVMWRVVSRRNRGLDAAFAPLRLKPVRVGVVQRGFVGMHGGRSVHGWVSKGPMLALYVGCQSGRRLGAGESGLLARGVGRAVGNDAHELADGLSVWSKDAAFTQAWLDAPMVREHLQVLCTALPGARSQVIVAPASIRLHVMYFALQEWTGESDLTADLVTDWTKRLVALADAIEQQPPGEEVEGRLEAAAHTDRNRMFRWTMIAVVAVLFFIVGGTLGLAAVVGLFGWLMG
jgi:hypothetical protein